MSPMAHAPILSKPLRVLLPRRRIRLREILLACTRKRLMPFSPRAHSELSDDSSSYFEHPHCVCLLPHFHMARNCRKIVLAGGSGPCYTLNAVRRNYAVQ